MFFFIFIVEFRGFISNNIEYLKYVICTPWSHIDPQYIIIIICIIQGDVFEKEAVLNFIIVPSLLYQAPVLSKTTDDHSWNSYRCLFSALTS